MGNSIALFDISMEICSRQFYFGDVGYAVISLRSCPLPIIPLCLEPKKQRSKKKITPDLRLRSHLPMGKTCSLTAPIAIVWWKYSKIAKTRIYWDSYQALFDVCSLFSIAVLRWRELKGI